jgi:hypothetical protein
VSNENTHGWCFAGVSVLAVVIGACGPEGAQTNSNSMPSEHASQLRHVLSGVLAAQDDRELFERYRAMLRNQHGCEPLTVWKGGEVRLGALVVSREGAGSLRFDRGPYVDMPDGAFVALDPTGGESQAPLSIESDWMVVGTSEFIFVFDIRSGTVSRSARRP